MNPKIILATASPYRIKSFSSLGLGFTSYASSVDEQTNDRPKTAKKLVSYLARLKAEDVSKRFNKEIVIGFDSVGDFNGEVLEKPRTRKDAYYRLEKLSGKVFMFYTGIYIINLLERTNLSSIAKTKCYMRDYQKSEIDKYLDQDRMYQNYAMGFSPAKYLSSTFIDRIEGGYNNITKGIPLEEVVSMLIKMGYKI